MSLHSALVAVIALATVAFVIGTAVERNSGESHGAEKAGETAQHEGGGEGGHAEGGAGEAGERAPGETRPAAQPEHHSELTPPGIDIETAPFVALTALASIALAATAWLRPHAIPLLVVVALAMLAFAALDIQEVVHQSDEARTGLAILAGFVAALHLAAPALATLMVRAARDPAGRRPAAPLRSAM